MNISVITSMNLYFVSTEENLIIGANCFIDLFNKLYKLNRQPTMVLYGRLLGLTMENTTGSRNLS